MIIKNPKYEITAVKPEQYPKTGMMEVAFVGRSNVGKSSFINTLLNRKNLARVGSTPGKTREINFYNIDDKFYMVDLPGYGYASVSKEKKSSWGQIIGTYLSSSSMLKLIVMLVDIRHSPSAEDRQMQEWLSANNVPYMIVATKSDKISRSQVNVRIADIRKTFGIDKDVHIIAFSSETRQGKEEVLESIAGTLGIE